LQDVSQDVSQISGKKIEYQTMGCESMSILQDRGFSCSGKLIRLARKMAFTLPLLAVPFTAAWASGNGFGPDPDIPEVLATFETRVEPTTARPGENVRLIITANIARGWYTYSVVPQGDMAPPPTKMTLDDTPLEVLGPVYETNPKVEDDKVFGIPLAYHPTTARFYQNLRVPEGVSLQEATISGKLKYQVCNSTFCTPPRNEPVTAVLTVEPGEVRPAFAFMERTIDLVDKEGNLVLKADTLENALSGGLGTFLLLAVGFGLLALLTPCVFPMIPVTVSFFTGASDHGRRSVLRLALLFMAGIIVSYTGLGLILTFALGASGVSQFATSPWINLAVAGFFVFFAMSLLGVFELTLPQVLVNQLNRSSYDIKGGLGVLLMGVAFTATSFTCTVPFVGTLLVAATQGQIFWPVVGMLVFSTVFALPFFLLALFPRYLLALRGKSGTWMVQLKVALGLLELVAALKFISNADLVWQWGVFNREVLLALSAVLFALSALITLGLVPWPGIKLQQRMPGHYLAGGLMLALVVYLGLGVGGRELDSYTEAYLPPSLTESRPTEAAFAGTEYVESRAVHELTWHPRLKQGLERAAETGKPLFVDFTGYTCINCRWMEKKIFAARPVYELFRDRFELVQLYTDGGEYAEENQQLQIERFRTLALPYYVILSPRNTVLAKHAGITPTPQEFIDFLTQGLDQQKLAEAPAASPEN